MPDREQPEQIWATTSVSDLEELIHSSIATYGEPALNSELAQRILARIAAEARPVASRRWLAWAVAVPVAACLIAFLVETRPVHNSAIHNNQASIPAEPHTDLSPVASNHAQPENRKKPIRNVVSSHRTTVAAETKSLPKLDVFPTPRQLSPEEQALADFAARAPISERKSLVEAQQQPDLPLTIAAIKIQPIELPELGTN